MFDPWNSLKLIILTLIYCIIHYSERHVCGASVITDSDICEFVNGQKIYCNCDNQGVNEARQVTCFLVSSEGLNQTDPVWNGFQFQRNITSLVFTSRLETKLSFLPVSALRNVADSLQTFNMNEMNLGVLEPNSMSNLSRLSKVSLESNEILGLSEHSFAHLPNLKSLSLSNNLIEVLKANVLVGLPKLEELFLDRNELTRIEDNAFAELKYLKEIDLRLNNINTITALTFSGLSNLKRLDLSSNQLKSIPNFAFTGTPLLRELDLAKNQIITIEDNAFHNMSHLMSLQLSENKIRYLSAELFRGSPKLALIDLSNNQLETIERQLIENLDHFRQEQFVIQLRENRLECDCRLLWLSSMSRKLGQLFKNELKNVDCTVKRELADLTIGQKIKVLRLRQHESIQNACQANTTTEQVFTTESALVAQNENQDHNQDHNLFPNILTKTNVSITNIDDYNNKIDGQTHEYLAAKTDLPESTESILHDVENSIANDALKPIGNEVKSSTKDSDSVCQLQSDTKIVISCILMIFIFCKNQFI